MADRQFQDAVQTPEDGGVAPHEQPVIALLRHLLNDADSRTHEPSVRIFRSDANDYGPGANDYLAPAVV
jgi:hypothetical protein